MNAAELLVYLESLRDRNVPLHKVEVLVTVDGYDHITDTDLFEPTAESPTWELYLADIISGRYTGESNSAIHTVDVYTIALGY